MGMSDGDTLLRAFIMSYNQDSKPLPVSTRAWNTVAQWCAWGGGDRAEPGTKNVTLRGFQAIVNGGMAHGFRLKDIRNFGRGASREWSIFLDGILSAPTAHDIPNTIRAYNAIVANVRAGLRDAGLTDEATIERLTEAVVKRLGEG